MIEYKHFNTCQKKGAKTAKGCYENRYFQGRGLAFYVHSEKNRLTFLLLHIFK
jgi:hypothetical protein